MAPPVHLNDMSNHTIATPITTWAELRGSDREVLNRAGGRSGPSLYMQRTIDAMEPYIGRLRLAEIRPTDLAAASRGLENGTKQPLSAKRPRKGLATSTVARCETVAVLLPVHDGAPGHSPTTGSGTGFVGGAMASSGSGGDGCLRSTTYLVSRRS